jgi:hypothetical protein
MKARRAIVIGVVLVGLAIGLAGPITQPATAASIRWLAVQLGVHRFGHLRAPDAIVAQAGPKDVGFECGKPSHCPSPEPPPAGGCGCIDVLPQGPSAFDVARDGSIWLLDIVNNRLLVWRPGHPAAAARSVELPKNLGVGDFTLGRDGTIYIYATPVGAGQRKLWALSPTGHVRWQAPITRELSNADDSKLRVGPNGALYTVRHHVEGTLVWTALTTAAGRPLSLAAQRRMSPFQPLTGNLRLLTTQPSEHEVHFAVVDPTDKVVRAWRVTSRTILGVVRAAGVLAGGDLLVTVDVTKQTQGKFLWEQQVLRLTSSGTIKRQFALDGRAAWDPDGTTVSTQLRIGRDGRLYQLRTDPKIGASIARYSLGRA